MSTFLRASAIIIGWWTLVAAGAEDRYVVATVGELAITSGALPTEDAPEPDWRRREMRDATTAYAVLDGGGEVYWESDGDLGTVSAIKGMKLALHTSAAGPLTGVLFVAKPDLSGMTPIAFSVPAARPADQPGFERIKALAYARLADARVPGAAWFRHQQREAEGRPGAQADARTRAAARGSENGLDETFDLFSGNRALGENLQLDRQLDVQRFTGASADAPAAPAAPPVPLAGIEGITVKEFDWAPLLKDLKPALDPLAALIPADQHALFFTSFAAMTALMDQADGVGSPWLRVVETRSEDARTRERYQKQLCLETGELARRFGAQLVASVAVTGSDPYLRSGSDVAILLEAKQADLLAAFITAKQQAAIAQGAAAVSGTQGAIAYTGARSADRAVCSYLARIGGAVVVTNSLAQLARLDAVASGAAPALATAAEYRFFRDRYRLGGEEGALLVLTDATIRRWCSPRWRIADSRRTRAAAILAELQATHADAIVAGQASAPAPDSVQGLDTVTLEAGGARSSLYGTLDFLTPIAELAIEQATKAEADAYARFRDRYQDNWRAYFDPIALQLAARPGKIAADLTVMPLIAGSDYREMMSLTQDRRIPAGAGDPHADALAHLVMALNLDSAFGKQAGGFLLGMNPKFDANPLGWLGEAVSLYADPDPFWDDFGKALEPERFLEKNYLRLPVVLQAEVKDAFKLTAFLAALRGLVEQSSPGMVIWETRTYQDLPYVRVAPGKEVAAEQPEMAKAALYYAATPTALIVTFNEDALKRALERRAARLKAKTAGEPPPAQQPWLGDSVSLHLGAGFLPVLRSLGERWAESGQDTMKLLAWSNLAILNEWHARYPGKDPVAVHDLLYKIHLACPGGGGYVWNERARSMESSIYGCPAAPKDGPELPALFAGFAGGDFGLGFEHQGVRARVQIDQVAK